MTREELRKEATTTVEWECTPMIERPIFVHAYITGAEPREKRIAELEAQIEQNKIDLAISEHDREHDDYEFTEVYTKVEQLEKENAELKEKLNFSTQYYQGEKAKEQLTKAKELIEELSSSLSGCECGEEECELLNRAEQFLKENIELKTEVFK